MAGKMSLAALSLALLSSVVPAQAAVEVYSAEYSISFLGIKVATSTFNSAVSDRHFRLVGSIASAGLGAMFDSTNGTTVSEGTFENSATRPNSYVVAYNYGKTAKHTTLSFSGGNLTSMVNVPELPPRRPDWVKVSDADLQGVADPISATLVRAASPAKVCGRTISFFDGEFRADIVLSPAKSKPDGLAKGTVACDAKLVPVSGYHANNASVKYLRTKSRMQIAFAPLGKTGVYAPVFASVGTQFGPVTIRTERITASQ
jgi:hypothetical protein